MNKFIGMSFVLALTFLVSIFSCSVYATQASSDTEVDLELATVINITTPETSNINCVSLNTLCTSTATVTVGTNNSTGYTLQLNATNGYSNSLTNAATSETIPTLAGAYAAGSFPTNYWGYTGGLDKSGESGGYNCASNYCPVLAYQSSESNYAPNHAIKISNAPASESTTITFGAKADVTKSSGTYSTSVTFTAVTNAMPAQPIQNGMDMQDIDSAACAATPTDVTYTVIDSRDNNEYTAAKLQDGNCWMTQNLALGDNDEEMELTSADSNVGPSGFTLPASVSEGEGDWSYDPDTPEFFNYADNYDDSSSKYGNYYKWYTATAGSGTSALDQDGDEAPYSICPKNWRLPSVGSTYTTADNEFYTMINNYITTGTWHSTDWNYWWSGVTTTNFTNTPVSLVFSALYLEGLAGQGSYGYWWSSTADSSNGAYNLQVTSDGYVAPRSSQYREWGYPIRCLIPGS